MKPIIILGPTAVGKTETAIKLAKLIDGEIISADTVQVYRYMDIGSAKPTEEEQKAVPHHLISIKNPDETFSSGEFTERVNNLIKEIRNRGKIPIIVGGGGFYIDSLVYGLDAIPPIESRIKRFYDDICDEFGSLYLYRLLTVVDEKWAKRISPYDSQRIKRALSVFTGTGTPLSSFFVNRKKENEFFIVVLYRDRETLYQLIEKRVDSMLKRGLVGEVKRLVEMGFAHAPPMKAIGYKEVLEYLAGRIDYNEMVRLIKKNTKAYAKRQLTLLKGRFKDALWINAGKENPVETILAAYKPSL